MNALTLLPAGAILLNLYALVLVVLRAPLYRTRLYRPMLLNIGLSVAPAAVLGGVAGLLVLVTVAVPNTVLLWAVVVVGLGAWLLLLPNSAYLITELNFSHRKPDERVPLWFDIVVVLTLALSGVVNTLLNVLLFQTILVLIAYPNDPEPLAHAAPWLLATGILVLVTFGMYLGRYVRFNSWDVKHPASFVRKLGAHFADGARVREALGFCLVHSVLLLIVYVLVMAPVIDLV